MIRYALLLVGIIGALLITLQLFHVPVAQLVVGTALTSVLLGIAAQQSLSNIFAGMVLLLSRPFRVGDAIQLHAGALGGQLQGVVTEIGITYIRLDTGETVMSVPNSQVLAAAVGPIPHYPEKPAPSPPPKPTTPSPAPPAPARTSDPAPARPGSGRPPLRAEKLGICDPTVARYGQRAE